MWVNQHSSELHLLYIVILVFPYLERPFLCFIDRWKSPCAILLCRYCMSLGFPLSFPRLLFLHALYRPRLELRVHRQEDCPLRPSFQKWLWRDMSRGITNLKLKYWFKLNCHQVKMQKVASVFNRIMPTDTTGEKPSAVQTHFTLWSQDHIRHEAVHSMPAGFHSLSFRLFPLLPISIQTIPLYGSTVTNACYIVSVQEILKIHK